MKQRYVGSTGLKVSRLGLGTWRWGTDTDEHDAADQLRGFVDAGGTLVDTAAGYGNGASEQLLGQLIGNVVDRDDLVVSTKAGIRLHRGERDEDVSRGVLLQALDTSLARLGVDHVDLWQPHVWSDRVPLEETMSALDIAVSSGRARYVGVSNYSGWQTAYAATHQLTGAGRARLAANQVEYSLLERGVEREVVPAAQALGLGILAWSPLGRGVLTGKYRTGIPSDSRAASATLAQNAAAYLNPESARIVEAVCKAAEGLDLSPTEVALAWVRDQPRVSSAIVGARTVGQLAAALTVEQVTLPEEIMDALDDVSAPDLGYPEA
jgi:aryl-alcohol dehydrogenase-like predicted oxidoreductase